MLKDTFCVELETGFVENYHGETVAAEADSFMRKRGFLLFDMTLHRVPRANQFAELSCQQLMWCQTLWMRDYLAAESWGINVPPPDREGALKALYICKALGFADYGFELAGYFRSRQLLAEDELASLSVKEAWTTDD